MEIHTLTPATAEPEHEHAEVIRTTARQVWSAEAAVDRALRETSLLVVSVIDGRVACGLAPSVVQKALHSCSATQSSLFATRASLLDAHAELSAVQGSIGAARVKLGGLNKNEHDDLDGDASWSWPFGSMNNVVPHPAAG